jgi:molybdopterin-guanine dinucleotide biosynthesis protein A
MPSALPASSTCRGVILAGGGATRFGGAPKGLAEVGGRRTLDRVAEVLAKVTGGPPILVANVPDAASWRPDLRPIADVLPGAGALGGLLTAVEAAAPHPALVVAWDMPFVPAGLLRDLVGLLDGHDVAIPASDGRRGLEPLCAAYGPACAAAIRTALARGDRRAIAFHPDVRVGILPLDAVRRHGDPDLLFFNVNTADDLARAEALWRRASSRS